MKKILLLVCLLAKLSAGKGQVIESVSLSGGYVTANQDTRHKNAVWETTSYTDSWGVEAGFVIFSSKFVSLGAQAGFIRKGYRQTPEDFTMRQQEDIRRKVKLNYIYIAPEISIGYSIKNTRPYFFAAPRLDYFLSARADASLNGTPIRETTTEDWYKRTHKKLVFGLSYGFGIEEKIKDKIGLGLKMVHFYDFTRSVNTTNAPHNFGYSYKQNAYAVYLTLRYYFGQ